MKNSIIITGLLLVCGLFHACDKEDRGGNTGGGELMEILLGSSGADGISTRADKLGFPNDGKIGVIASVCGATVAAGDAVDGTMADWNNYLDGAVQYINNTVAVVDSKDADDNYLFKWNGSVKKYWPFNGNRLVFAAYSPATSASSGHKLSADKKQMTITLKDGMGDILYATNNYALKAYDKTAEGTGVARKPKAVDLGTFRHALSKLTIEIVPNGVINPDVEITELSVASAYEEAALDMFDPTKIDELVLGTELVGDSRFKYEIVKYTTGFGAATNIKVAAEAAKPANNGKITREVFLFPGTHDKVEVKITFADHAINSLTSQRFIADIDGTTADNNQTKLRLERGRNTTVRFNVKSKEVLKPGDVALQGSLTDWDQAGDFEMIIQ